MAEEETCCTCATILTSKPPAYGNSPDSQAQPVDEKHSLDTKAGRSSPSRDSQPQSNWSLQSARRLPCCNRTICGDCLSKNPRFETYCPFCQISTTPTALPQGLKDPPAYTSAPPSPRQTATKSNDSLDNNTSSNNIADLPPSYSASASASTSTSAAATTASQEQQSQDLTHHLRPTDTFASLSLAYNIPAAVLRTHNNIYADNLLSARRTVSIPKSHYAGPSLSPDPIDSEEETERKTNIRRFMLATKCHEYEVAELYLGQVGGDVEAAVEKWRDDERWERENPFDRAKIGSNNSKAKRRTFGGGLASQLR